MYFWTIVVVLDATSLTRTGTAFTKLPGPSIASVLHVLCLQARCAVIIADYNYSNGCYSIFDVLPEWAQRFTTGSG